MPHLEKKIIAIKAKVIARVLSMIIISSALMTGMFLLFNIEALLLETLKHPIELN